jgi:hypothetical protein
VQVKKVRRFAAFLGGDRPVVSLCGFGHHAIHDPSWSLRASCQPGAVPCQVAAR